MANADNTLSGKLVVNTESFGTRRSRVLLLLSGSVCRSKSKSLRAVLLPKTLLGSWTKSSGESVNAASDGIPDSVRILAAENSQYKTVGVLTSCGLFH